MSQEIEIGLGKKGRLGYALDDVAIVPSRRTRDPEDVSTSWQIDAYEFDVPVIGAPMDSVTSPATAIAMGKMGALGVLDLEGLWTRYEDPTSLLDEIAGLPADQATERIQQIYAEPVKPELITQRLHEIRAAGVTVAGALSPQRTQQFYSTVVDAGVDLFVIRGTVVSAEHVSSGQEPLNLKKFIYDLDVPVIVGGASNYTAALHLMRTGAAGVLVGFGGGAVSATRQTIGVQAPMATAIAMGKMGALGVLDLEGLWTRYEDPTPLLDEIAGLPADQATERIQQIYAEPVKPELITQRLHEIRAAGVTVAGALSPQRTQQFYSTVVDAGVDLFVIRGTVVSAEHVSSGQEPLNLKKFIYDLDVPVIVGGASNYTAALHLMRTGAAGVLVGFGGGAVSATRQTIGVQAPMATAIADVAEARRDYMDESGGRYVQVIADGGMGDSGSFVKALALGADAVMLGAPLARATEAPGKGTHWGSEARHQTLPRGYRTTVGTVGPLEQVLFGPSHQADGKTNFIGALKRAMASTGYVDVKNFQRCGMVVNPYSAR